MQVAPGRQDRRRAQQVAARRGAHEAAVERVQDRGDLVVVLQQAVGLRQFLEHGERVRVGRQRRRRQRGGHRHAAHDRLDRGPRRPQAVRGVGQRGQHVDALLHARRLADHVQAVRDQGVFEFQHGRVEALDARRRLAAPRRLGLREVERRRLRLDQRRQLRVPGAVAGLEAAPALDRGLQVEQAAVEPGMGHRRRQVADQRRRRAALGDRALGRVVGGVEIEVGQVADQPVRPARAGQAGLLARHEFQRPMGAEVQHRIRAEILAHPAVEGREGVGRGEALLEQQAHRVAFVAEGGLDADEDVAEALAEHEQRAAVALLLAGRRAPRGLDLRQPGLARTWSSARMRACTLAAAPKRLALPVIRRSRSASTPGGTSTV